MEVIHPVNKTEILNRAVRIGDFLIQKAKTDGDHVFWFTENKTEGTGKTRSIGILYGVSGILLFFNALYKATRDPAYLDIVRSGIEWVTINSKKKETPVSFYHGKGGVIYTLLKIFETTNDKTFIAEAESVAKTIVLPASKKDYSLQDGLAGVMLSLLHLHAHTKSLWITESIGNLTECLIARARIHPKGGIFWPDYNRINVSRGLCGFAEGNAGIAFVLLELGRYFKNNAFNDLAEEALQYIHSQYDSMSKNWPDFKSASISEDDLPWLVVKNRFGLVKNLQTENKRNDGWLSGKSGIVLSLLHQHETTGSAASRKVIDSAVRELGADTTFQYKNASLTEGYGGVAMALMEACRRSQKPQPEILHRLHNLQNNLWHAFEEKRKRKKNSLPTAPYECNLAYGAAGIGYLLLSLYQFQDTHTPEPSVLKPSIGKDKICREKTSGILHAEREELFWKILSNAYPRTTRFIDALQEKSNIETRGNTIGELEHAMHEWVSKTQQSRMIDCMNYETAVLKNSVFNKNKTLFCIRKFGEIATTKYLLARAEKSKMIREKKFVLAGDIEIHISGWPWASADIPGGNSYEDEQDCSTLLMTTMDGVLEYDLDQAKLALVSEFTTPKLPIVVFQKICCDNEIPLSELEDLLLTHFFELVNIGALVVVKNYSLRNLFR
jgi:hypothetical protein